MIGRIFDGVPDDEKVRMTSGNVIQLYGISEDALPGGGTARSD